MAITHIDVDYSGGHDRIVGRFDLVRGPHEPHNMKAPPNKRMTTGGKGFFRITYIVIPKKIAENGSLSQR